MPRDTQPDDDPDRAAYVQDLYDQFVEPAPDRRLDTLCGLDDLATKARDTLIEPHRRGHHAAAPNTALINPQAHARHTAFAEAIAGDLCAAGFDFARIDFAGDRHHRRLRDPDEIVRYIDAAVHEQQLVLLFEGFDHVHTGGPDQIRQRFHRLTTEDAAVVILCQYDDQRHHAHRGSTVDMTVDVTFTVPDPDQPRRRDILATTLTDRAATCDALAVDTAALGLNAHSEALDDYDVYWVQQVAERAVAIAASRDTPTLDDEHIETAIEQIDDERPAHDESGRFSRQDDESLFTATVPEVTFDDIGGLDDVITRLTQVITVQDEYADVYDAAGFDTSHGVLLAGPPGTGKTLLAKALATELDRTFLSVKGPELKHPLYGVTEARLRELFETADEEAPSIVFFDEFDAIAGDRTDLSHSATQSVVTTMLTELDGIEDREDLLVVAATNRRDAIDDAILRPGRIDDVIDVPVPGVDAQAEIFEIHTESLPLAADVTAEWFVEASPTELTGARIETVCKAAFRNAVSAAESGGDSDNAGDEGVVITRVHVETALDAVAHADDPADGSPAFV